MMSSLPRRMLEKSTLLDHMEVIDFKTEPTGCSLSHIIATIGPSCRDEETIYRMLKAGMNIARINFSHDSQEDHSLTLKYLRNAEKRYSKDLGYDYFGGIIGDLKGREICTGTFLDYDSVDLSNGERVKLVTNPEFYSKCNSYVIYIDYENFIKEVEVGQKVYLDDDNICLEIKEVNPESVKCQVLVGGTLRNRVTVVVPEAKFSLPILSAKDLNDIKFCLQNNIHYLMLSKISSKEDVMYIRNALGYDESRMKIITKIESCRALKNFDEIVSVSDAILISRINLAIELKVGRVFLVQKALIERCISMGKPIFVGQQILMSMKESPVPFRTDICDIGNVLIDGADGVMLSCVTAVGKYPVEAVEALSSTRKESEIAIWHPKSHDNIFRNIKPDISLEKITAISAVLTSFNVDAAVIVVIAVSGQSALLISNNRPKCPIIAVTRNDEVARKINLYRGVIPFHTKDAHKTNDHNKNLEADIKLALNIANHLGTIKNSDAVVLVSPFEETCTYANNVKVVFTYFDKNVVEWVYEKQRRLVKRLEE